MKDEKMNSKPKQKKKGIPKPKNQNLKTERDGNTFERQTWAGKVVNVLDALGTGNDRPWFTHKAIMRHLRNEYEDTPDKLNQYLLALIKSGHLEKAIRPDRIRDKQVLEQNYIYRRTKKAFKEYDAIPYTKKGYQLWIDNLYFPKWLRDMMH